jgi:hypothetical protein
VQFSLEVPPQAKLTIKLEKRTKYKYIDKFNKTNNGNCYLLMQHMPKPPAQLPEVVPPKGRIFEIVSVLLLSNKMLSEWMEKCSRKKYGVPCLLQYSTYIQETWCK